jgi:hypothetical protein
LNRRISRLLARGGRTLGIAAVAMARGQRPGEGPWHALAPDLVAAAEEVLAAVGEERDPAVLAAALEAALGPRPANAAPAWLGTLDEAALGRIAAVLGDLPLPAALRFDRAGAADPALWALSLALCRNPDTVLAVADGLGPGDLGARLLGWSRLAQAVARPGEPSRMRRRLRTLLAAGTAGDG